MNITRHNVEELLDAGHIEMAMRNGNWWRIRRNGKTQKWKKDANRIRIPYKAGLKIYGAIVEEDFKADGTLRQDWFRLRDGL